MEEIKPRYQGVLHWWAFWISIPAGGLLVWAAGRSVTGMVLAVYAASTTLVLGVSGHYNRHVWRREWAELLWKRFDHSSIFVLIAATCTQFALLHERPRPIMAAAWTTAAIGVLVKCLWPNMWRGLGTGIYMGFGAAVLWLVGSVADQLAGTALSLIAGCGLLYIAAGVVYATRWPDPWPKTFGFLEIAHALEASAAALMHLALAIQALTR